MPEHRSSGADDGRGCRAYRQGEACDVCDGLLSQGFALAGAKPPTWQIVVCANCARQPVRNAADNWWLCECRPRQRVPVRHVTVVEMVPDA